MTKSEILNDLFKKYGLVYDSSNPDSKDNDVYVHKHYKIITRTGIQKIERAAGIHCEMEPVPTACGKDFFTIKGTGIRVTSAGEKPVVYTTFASASDLTSKNSYYAEMCEKRCRSRLILTLAGLYELGVFGEDEADDFARPTGTYEVKPVVYRGAGAAKS